MNRTKPLLASTAVQLALVLPGAALAQTQPTPPERYTLDPNGVDLVSGGFVHGLEAGRQQSGAFRRGADPARSQPSSSLQRTLR